MACRVSHRALAARFECEAVRHQKVDGKSVGRTSAAVRDSKRQGYWAGG